LQERRAPRPDCILKVQERESTPLTRFTEREGEKQNAEGEERGKKGKNKNYKKFQIHDEGGPFQTRAVSPKKGNQARMKKEEKKGN